VSGVPSGPANAGGLNNSLHDPSGAGNASKTVIPPGTNSAGTANSSGSASARSESTTGAASTRLPAGGTSVTGPSGTGDAAVDAQDRTVHRKIKSICKGC
jgi:hypothetical protein